MSACAAGHVRLKRTFGPEFLNNVDEVIASILGRTELEQIVPCLPSPHASEPKNASRVHARCQRRSCERRVQQKRRTAAQASDQRMVEDRLSDEIIAGRVKDGQEVIVDAGRVLVFHVRAKKVRGWCSEGYDVGALELELWG